MVYSFKRLHTKQLEYAIYTVGPHTNAYSTLKT